MPAVVQSTGNTATASPLSLTLGSNTTAGNCLVVAVCFSGLISASTITGITLGGSAGNFALALAIGTSTSAGGRIEFWVDPNCAGSQTAISVTFTNGSSLTGVTGFAWEASGVVASSPLDKTASNPDAASSTSWTSTATGTTTQASEIAFGAVGVSTSTANTITGPTGSWVNLSQQTVANEIVGMGGSQILSATGTVTYSGTISTSDHYSAGVITLKGAAATAGPAAAPGLLKGRMAAFKGRSFGQAAPPPVIHPSVPSPFHAPHSLLRGQVPVRGKTFGQAAPPPLIHPSVPSPFYPPHSLLRGAAAAVRGKLAGLAGRAGLPSPFYPPHGLLRGPRPAAVSRTVSVAAPRAAPPPPPVLGLLCSVAPQAGTDVFGFSYLAGVTAYVTIPAGASVPAGRYAVNLGQFLAAAGFEWPALTLQNLTSPVYLPPQLLGGASAAAGFAAAGLLSGLVTSGDSPAQLLMRSALTAAAANGLAQTALTGNLSVSGLLQAIGDGISGDANTYDTARLSMLTPGQTISSTSQTLITGLSVALGTGSYIIRGWINYKGGAAAGTANFEMQFSGTASGGVGYVFNSGAASSEGVTGFGAAEASPTLRTSIDQLTIAGNITVTGGGTLQLSCAEGTSGDTVIITGGFLEIYPVIA